MKNLPVHKFVEYYSTEVETSVGQKSIIFPIMWESPQTIVARRATRCRSIIRTHKHYVPQRNILSPGLLDARNLCAPL